MSVPYVACSYYIHDCAFGRGSLFRIFGFLFIISIHRSLDNGHNVLRKVLKKEPRNLLNLAAYSNLYIGSC